MNLLRAYNRCLLVVIVLGITSFSSAAGPDGTSTALLAAFALPVAVGAWWLSVRHRMLLPRSVVNLLLLAVLAYAALQAAARRFNVDGVAELVIFIQLIKLGDRRAPRDDAQVLSLAVFLAIAAMLTSNNFWVGLQLIVFIPVLIATVMLFQLYAGWSLAAGAVAATAAEPRGDPGSGGQLRTTAAFATVATVVVGAGVFIIMPRGVGENAFGAWRQIGRSSTGFTDHVKLGSRSVISQSPKIVLDLVVRDSVRAGANPGMNIGSPDVVQYLRGAVLDRYEKGAWVPDRGATSRMVDGLMLESIIPLIENTMQPAVAQTITVREMESQGAPLFALWRPVSLEVGRGTKGIAVNERDRTLRRSGSPGQVQYTVWSVLGEVPGPEPTRRTPASFGSTRIQALAAAVVRDGGAEPDPALRPITDDFRAARLIQDHLRRGYTYSLVEPGVPEGEDPIENFLFESEMGHCEYFAAAMVAMCRSIGVNARMVAGYVAAEYDEATSRYVVREANAHAWVEAEGGVGRWRRFDPTPPDDLTRLHRAKPGLFSRLRRALDSVEYAWNTSIVGFDQGAQQRLLSASGDEQGGLLMRMERLSRRVRGIGPRGMLSAVGFGVAVFVAVAGVGLALRAAVILLARRVRGLPRVRLARSREPAGVQVRVYRQLLEVLRRRGHAKPEWRPPLDHAAAVDPADAALAAATRELAGLYYRARFGGRPITAAEAAAARSLLTRVSKERPRG